MSDAAQLPINMVPNTDPPVFRWRHTVSTISGVTTQECEGQLPPSVEGAVKTLIGIAKQALMDNAGLRGQVQGMADRIASQSELLGKSAERDKQRQLEADQRVAAAAPLKRGR